MNSTLKYKLTQKCARPKIYNTLAVRFEILGKRYDKIEIIVMKFFRKKQHISSLLGRFKKK